VSCGDILRVQRAAALQGKAAASDAGVKTIAQRFESFYLLVKTFPPPVGNL
jgi:hypothetical protein